MFENLNKFRSIFLFDENVKTKTFIGISPKFSNKIYNIAIELHNILPDSKLIKNISIKDFFYLVFTTKQAKNFVFLYFRSKKLKKSELLLFFPLYNVTYKFHISNFNSCIDYHFLGNCLKWSKPIMVFDSYFDKKPHLKILKNILIKIISSKAKNLQSESIVDHIIYFVYVKFKIWVRVYQVKRLDFLSIYGQKTKPYLVEIGPRVSLFPEKIWTCNPNRKVFDLL